MATHNCYEVVNSGLIVHESDESDIVITYRGNTFNVFLVVGNDAWENVGCFTKYDVSDTETAKQFAQQIAQSYDKTPESQRL